MPTLEKTSPLEHGEVGNSGPTCRVPGGSTALPWARGADWMSPRSLEVGR